MSVFWIFATSIAVYWYHTVILILLFLNDIFLFAICISSIQLFHQFLTELFPFPLLSFKSSLYV
jgi:hypothetical protein